MPVTTVLSEEGSATIIDAGNDNGGAFAHRFSWSAAFAGAFLATAVTFFLLALGAGFGLSLVAVQTTATPGFLTGGAIYFFAAQAFGFAAGGHLAGRLIGPAAETAKEEEFRSAAHGLVVWALTVVATATLVAIGAMVAGSSAASVMGSQKAAPEQAMTPSYVGYWVDILFTPGPGPSQASLAGVQYAQADTGATSDAAPAPPPDNDTMEAPAPTGVPRSLTPSPSAAPAPAAAPLMNSGAPATATAPAPAPASNPATTSTLQPSGPRDQQIPASPAGFVPPPSVAADKAVTGRILEIGMAKGAHLNPYDRDRIAALVAQDTGLSLPDAQRRVDNADMRIHNDEVRAADDARRIAGHASLWIAFSLLFGAIVSTIAAMSARWEDDRMTFGWPRREPE